MPSSPPSPVPSTSLTLPTLLTVPSSSTCLIRSVSRSLTSAEPSGRNASPHGTSRPLAMMRSKLACSTRSALAVADEPVVAVPDALDVGPASAGGFAFDDPEQAEHTRTNKAAMAVPVEALILGDPRRPGQIGSD